MKKGKDVLTVTPIVRALFLRIFVSNCCKKEDTIENMNPLSLPRDFALPSSFLRRMGWVLLVFFWGAVALSARVVMKGVVTDAKTLQPLAYAHVVLRHANDTTRLLSLQTDEQGVFCGTVNVEGHCRLEVSFVGYKSEQRRLHFSSDDSSVQIDTLRLTPQYIALKEAVVRGNAAQLTLRGDTFVYNASAFRVPPGSSLKALVEQLPGLHIDSDGSLTWRGKKIVKILVNGKEFFGNNTQTALQNLPTEMVENLKAYEKQSDFSAHTGIKDGKKTQVLDVTLKKEYKGSYIANVEAGYGTNERYLARTFGTRFTDRLRTSVYGSVNNISDENSADMSSGDWGDSQGGMGQNTYRKVGAETNWNNGKTEREAGALDLTLSGEASHNNSNVRQWISTETFLTAATSSFSNYQSVSHGKTESFNVNASLKWTTDSLGYFTFNGSYAHNYSKYSVSSRSAEFSANPYQLSAGGYPLDLAFEEPISPLLGLLVNRSNTLSLSRNNSSHWNVGAMYTRRLSRKGRALTVDFSLDGSTSLNPDYNLRDIAYFAADTLSSRQLENRYSRQQQHGFNYSADVRYSEPLGEGLTLSFTYAVNGSKNRSKYPSYLLDSLASWQLSVHPFGTHPTEADSLQRCFDVRNSNFSRDRDFQQEGNLEFSLQKEKWQVWAAARLTSKYEQTSWRQSITDTTFHRTTLQPQIYSSVTFTPATSRSIDLNYSGSIDYPDMNSLVNVANDIDPLNITRGNPNLRSSWSNAVELRFSQQWDSIQTNLDAGLIFYNQNNATASKLYYNAETGVRTTQPENVKGTQNTRASVGVNSSLGKAREWNLGVNTYVLNSKSYNYVSTGSQTDYTLNTGHRWTYNLGAKLGFRRGVFSVSAQLNFYCRANRNSSKSASNETSKLLTASVTPQLVFPFGLHFSTSFGLYNPYGYNDPTMNRNQWIWNAQLQQSFLKKKQLIVKVEYYDMLHSRRSDYSATSALERTNTHSNAFMSYGLVRVQYLFNLKSKANVNKNEL